MLHVKNVAKTVKLVELGCGGCDGCNYTAPARAENYDGVLRASFHAPPPGAYLLCSETAAGVKTQVAEVLTGAGRCAFNSVEGTPCEIGPCRKGAEAGETCMIYVSEYCTSHPVDPGCELFLPNFTRAGLATKHTIIFDTPVAEVDATLNVFFMHPSCGCSPDGLPFEECMKLPNCSLPELSLLNATRSPYSEMYL